MCCVRTRRILLCSPCSRAHADAFIKNTALSAYCFLFSYKYSYGRSVARSETHKHKRIWRIKGRKCSADAVLSCAFVPGSSPGHPPLSGTTARNEGLFSGGSGAPRTPPTSSYPRPVLVTSNSLCLSLSKGPEGSTPELSHHSTRCVYTASD